jgi:hypothetical protein
MCLHPTDAVPTPYTSYFPMPNLLSEHIPKLLINIQQYMLAKTCLMCLCSWNRITFNCQLKLLLQYQPFNAKASCNWRKRETLLIKLSKLVLAQILKCAILPNRTLSFVSLISSNAFLSSLSILHLFRFSRYSSKKNGHYLDGLPLILAIAALMAHLLNYDLITIALQSCYEYAEILTDLSLILFYFQIVYDASITYM